MAENLVIVESPAKAGTIQKYLGEGFVVKSSKGHIRDLHEKSLSIDIENGFRPEYEVPSDKRSTVTELKKLAGEADTVWLASDEDREGEAISWHLAETLKLDPAKTRRIVFHEITKPAILHAIENPRDIDMNLVNAQQARRVLDRLVGFELSPVLWRKIQPKLSAGRVQSVALRLIVDREREILDFKPVPYYKVEAVFHPEGSPEGVAVRAILDRKFENKDQALAFLKDSAEARFRVSNVEKKEGTRCPAAPFTTSTLQQEASRKLKMSVSQTMSVAQRLYESGLITYMRTDSTNLSGLAINAAKKFITENYGADYSKVRQYKTSAKGAQEAHEAIRPTYIDRTSIEGTPQEKKLYELIWKRTVASQMEDAKILKTDIKLASDRRSETFGIQALQILDYGFLRLYAESTDDEQQGDQEQILPELPVGTPMLNLGMDANCKFTAAPPRYSEATLVKKLEELEIGRPSTYATIISTLTKARGYVVKGDKEGRKVAVVNLSLRDGAVSESRKSETIGAEKGKLIPQEIGLIVTDYLVGNFKDILDYSFTADVEQKFDLIAEGKISWNSLIAEFYSPFHAKVESSLSNHEYSHVEREIGTDPADGKKIIARFGQYGPYVQKGEGEDRVFASLAPGQLIESITLEDALRLFTLPRTVGRYEDKDIICTKGKFGPYIKFGDRNISLPKGKNPTTISLEECVKIITDSLNRPAKEIIREFDGDIKIINGTYGPYIKCGDSNYRIPKGTDASLLTEEECRTIISEGTATNRGGRRGTAKASSAGSAKRSKSKKQ